MDSIPNGHHPEWTPSRMDTIPNGHNPEWTQSRMDTIPNGHHPECAPSRMGTIPNGHHPEWAPSRMDTIPNEYLHSYSSVVYACLVRTFYENAFNEKLTLALCKSSVRIRPQYHVVIVCKGVLFITSKVIKCIIFCTV